VLVRLALGLALAAACDQGPLGEVTECGGACQPGQGNCSVAVGAETLQELCDPGCGDAAAACRPCRIDEQCENELGEDAVCEEECGTCCVVGNPVYPCGCAINP
jgi:hypothetical protein